jgi:phage I-like protein
MSELKTQTEGDILEIQLKYARADGKSQRVEALEKMIAERNAPVLQKSTEAPVRRHRQEGPR